MSAQTHRQHAEADQDSNRDQHGMNPEECGRITVPMTTRPGTVITDNRLREARPDHHIEDSRSNQKPARTSRHWTIPSRPTHITSQEYR